MTALNGKNFPSLDIKLMDTLNKSGYLSILDLLVAQPSNVARQCNLKIKDLMSIRQAVLVRHHQVLRSRGDQIYNEMRLYASVFPTGIKSLDRLLRGGLFSGELVELFGPSSSGKTQICFSVAACTTVIAKQLVVYVDSNGSFSVDRIKSIMKNHGIDEIKLALSRIICRPCFNVHDLFAVLDACRQQQEVKIIIIDSIANLVLPILGGGPSTIDGLGLLTRLINKLKSLATQNQIAILVTNGVVQWRDNDSSEEDESRPSLGRYWSYVPNVRLSLSSKGDDNRRLATITVSKTVAFGTEAEYRLTSAGVESESE